MRKSLLGTYAALALSSSACTDGDFYIAQIRSSASPSEMLVLTSPRVPRSNELRETLGEYISELSDNQGIGVNFVEIGSEVARRKYGIAQLSYSDESDVAQATSTLLDIMQPRYVLILGGDDTLPVPKRRLTDNHGEEWVIYSDHWYLDQDGDDVIDENISIGRLPSYPRDPEPIIEGLEKAIEMHQNGGMTIRNEVKLGIDGNEAPPYGLCDTCNRDEDLLDDLYDADFVWILGKGNKDGFYQGVPETKDGKGGAAFLEIDDLDRVEFGRIPLIAAIGPVGTADLYTGQNKASPQKNIATELIRAGAGAYIGSTSQYGGYSYPFLQSLDDGLVLGLPIGETLAQAVRLNGLKREHKVLTGQYNLFGDPSVVIRREQN